MQPPRDPIVDGLDRTHRRLQMFDETSPERLIEQATQHSEAGEDEQARALFDQAVRVAEDSGNPETWREALLAFGSFLTDRDEPVQAMRYARRAYELSGEWADRAMMARAAGLLGVLEHSQQHDDRALAFFEEARDLQDGLGDESGMTSSLSGIAAIHAQRDEHDAALAAYHKVLELVELDGDPIPIARTHCNIAAVLRGQGDTDGAEKLLREALDTFDEAEGHELDRSLTRSNLAGIARERGDVPAARALYRAALEGALEGDDQLSEGLIRSSIADLDRLTGQYEDAITGYRTAQTCFTVVDEPGHYAVATTRLGDSLVGTGRFDDARAAFDEALRAFQGAHDQHGQAMVHTAIGGLLAGSDRMEEARRHLDEAQAIADLEGDPRIAALVLGNRGNIARESDDPAEAARLFALASERFEAAGDAEARAMTARDRAAALDAIPDQQAEAGAAWDTAVALAREATRDPEMLIDTLGMRADTYEQLDDLAQARTLIEAARDAAADAHLEGRVAEMNVRLGGLLHRAWEPEAARVAFEDAIAGFDRAGATLDKAFATLQLALLFRGQGRFEQAEAAFRASIALYIEGGEPVPAAIAAADLGDILTQADRHTESEALLSEAYRRAREADDAFSIARVRASLGSLRGSMRDPAAAREHFRAAIKQFADIGGVINQAVVLGWLADLERGLGHADSALPVLEEQIALYQDQEEWDDAAQSYLAVSDIHYDGGRFEDAVAVLRQAADAMNADEAAIPLAMIVQRLGLLAHEAGKADEALALLARQLELLENADDMLGTVFALRSIAEVLTDVGRHRDAVERFDTAIKRAIDAGNVRQEAISRSYRHRPLAKLGDRAATEATLRAAIDRFGVGEYHADRALTQARLAGFLVSLGRFDDAFVAYDDALASYDKASDTAGRVQVLSEIAAARVKADPAGDWEVPLHEALALSQGESFTRFRGHLLARWAKIYRTQDKHDEAVRKIQEARVAFEVAGQPLERVRALHWELTTERMRRNHDAAIVLATLVCDAWKEIGSIRELGWAELELATDIKYAGRYDEAMPYLQSARDRFRQTGVVEGERETMIEAAHVIAERGHYRAAIRLLRKSIHLNREGGRAAYDLACYLGRLLGGPSPPVREKLIEQALQHLELAVRDGWLEGPHMDEDPDLDPFRELPRYLRLREHISARMEARAHDTASEKAAGEADGS